MRDGAIEIGEHELYNDYMIKLKSTYKVGRFSKFWENICSESITLISAADTSFPCIVTRSEAEDYLKADVTTTVSVPIDTTPKVAEEEEDLFGEMM